MSFRDPDPVPSPPGSITDPTGFVVNGRTMLIVTAVIVILFIVILMVSLHLYSRFYLHRSRRSRASAAITFNADPSSTTRGLDPAVVKSLPVFMISMASEATECAVCLSGFEENESGRVLPSCKHAFHAECIDMWFHSHSSCPLCRSLVGAEEVAISVSGDGVVGDGTLETSDRGDSTGNPATSEAQPGCCMLVTDFRYLVWR